MLITQETSIVVEEVLTGTFQIAPQSFNYSLGKDKKWVALTMENVYVLLMVN